MALWTDRLNADRSWRSHTTCAAFIRTRPRLRSHDSDQQYHRHRVAGARPGVRGGLVLLSRAASLGGTAEISVPHPGPAARSGAPAEFVEDSAHEASDAASTADRHRRRRCDWRARPRLRAVRPATRAGRRDAGSRHRDRRVRATTAHRHGPAARPGSRRPHHALLRQPARVRVVSSRQRRRSRHAVAPRVCRPLSAVLGAGTAASATCSIASTAAWSGA